MVLWDTRAQRSHAGLVELGVGSGRWCGRKALAEPGPRLRGPWRRLGLSHGRPGPMPSGTSPRRSAAEDPAGGGVGAESTCGTMNQHVGVAYFSPPKRRQPLRGRGRERRPRARRSGGPGSGAARRERSERGPGSRPGVDSALPKAERSSTRPQGRDRRRRWQAQRAGSAATGGARDCSGYRKERSDWRFERKARSRSDAPKRLRTIRDAVSHRAYP